MERLLSIYILIFIVGTVIISLILGTFFNKLWSNDIYQNVGSMIGGVFGSAASLAGALAAILIAIDALKISKAQYRSEVDKFIQDVAINKMSPAIQKVNEVIISFSTLVGYIISVVKLNSIEQNQKKYNVDEYTKTIWEKLTEFQRKIIALRTDIIACTLYDLEIEKLNEIIEKLELSKINTVYYPRLPRDPVTELGIIFVNPVIFDNIMELIERILTLDIREKVLDIMIEKYSLQYYERDVLKRKVILYTSFFNQKDIVTASTKSLIETLKRDDVRKKVWPHASGISELIFFRA